MEPAYPEPRPKVPLSATTTPPKPPAPTTIAGKLRAKLPSRGWMIFWGTVGTIGGLVTRDHYLTVDAKKRVADKVDILAKQPCGVQDMPRKVTVYLTAPPGDGIHKTRHYFKQFVKPVFDAAAVDYEVREGLAAGQIQAMVAADVRKKRQIAAGKVPVLTEEEQAAPVVPLKSISDGIVVLGRIALGEVLQGYNDGCLQSLDDPEPVIVVQEITEEKKEEQEIKDTKTEESSSESTSSTPSEPSSESLSSTEASTATTPEAAAAKTEKAVETKPEPVQIPQDEAYFSVPPTGLEPIGYIPFKNLIGFRNFHKKIFALFNSYDCVEYAGNSVMKIAFAETKDMEKEDLDMGRDEEPLFAKYRGPVEIDILDRVQEKVKFFISPTHIPEPKVAVAAEGDELHQ
ncbi:mitochondrial import inner membrane translocase subunit TIM54 [Entomortierella parvispora]|uniref:Mitochondrial import inner membrane translocase subunit TIM54 n=1 Tax=Entomortierella parvispora TaxID=205924 RepID=A0A9P3H5G6_9FUNG|nr:mitochondrial import inner membrane translocase subunit TIM54 [Entomortierella parvispora]